MIESKLNILVTGCGGDIGQSIGKILNQYPRTGNLYGMDMSDKHPGKFIFENFSLGLPCRDEKYISSLELFVVVNDIDLIIPASEPELRFLSEIGIGDSIGKAKLIMSSDLSRSIGFDKLVTAEFLRENNLPFPETKLVLKVDTIDSFPFIMKSRTGSGSSQVHVVRDSNSFKYLKEHNENFILQEYLDNKLGEFTCGVYRSSKKEVRSIILMRELTGGYSGYGKVVENDQITVLLENIAINLSLRGSINVQLRITEKGPVVFEINPRFSSTVLFRHMFGFEDLIWSIEDIIDLEISPYKNNSSGKEFFKGFNEYIK
ncbi:ATP-grasp domain-containing protein [Flavobacteriaceae bacterium]|nr:ATP-grasp domain-containing protein [Flavobacteriaceae bacterium]